MSKKLVGKAKAKARNKILKNRNQSEIKGDIMTDLKTINFKDIKTPTTVEDFRDNLRKYVCALDENTIYVQGHDGISIDLISSFDDIYKLTGKGWSGDNTTPNICLKIDWSINGKGGVTDFMSKTNQFLSCNGYWEDKDSQFKIYDIDEKENAIAILPNPQWVALDNQILRELYAKMFGEFSGYVSFQEVGLVV